MSSRLMWRSASLLSFLCAVTLATPAVANPIVYDNGGPNQANGNEATQWIQAEDFTLLSATTLTDIHFWTIEASGAYQGTVLYRIYGNAGTQPDETNILREGTLAPTRTATGNSPFGLDEHSYDADIAPLVLGPGTYWLGLHNGPLTTTSRLEWYWETTANNLTLRGREDIAPFDTGGWFDNGQEHAFNLTGTVPEPTSLALLGLGLAGAAVRRSRKK